MAARSRAESVGPPPAPRAPPSTALAFRFARTFPAVPSLRGPRQTRGAGARGRRAPPPGLSPRRRAGGRRPRSGPQYRPRCRFGRCERRRRAPPARAAPPPPPPGLGADDRGCPAFPRARDEAAGRRAPVPPGPRDEPVPGRLVPHALRPAGAAASARFVWGRAGSQVPESADGMEAGGAEGRGVTLSKWRAGVPRQPGQETGWGTPGSRPC